jgi:hypothetical protein
MLEKESKIYELYISQLSESTNEYDKFIGKLKSSENFKYNNNSIPGKTSKKELLEQMKSVDVVVLLSGYYSVDKDIVQRILDTAVELDKPIVIIRPYGMENVPGSIEKAASEVVGWNAMCIIDSIRESLEEEEYED